MILVILGIATLMIIAWLILLFRVTKEDWLEAAYAKVFDNHLALKSLRLRDMQTSERLCRYSGFLLSVLTGFYHFFGKKAQKLETDIKSLHKGNIKSVNTFIMPGYVLQREFDAIGKGNIHKIIMSGSLELYGKKHAAKKTKQLLAKMLSYPLISVAITLVLGALSLATDNITVGAAIIGLGTLLVLALVYAMYDELNDKVQKRRCAIIRQFPGVVSKLALLVTSGMIMDKAWKETALSQETELYLEMRKTSKELENLVSPESAFGSFINRCNTKESAKLASAIMQNLSKGNAEIGKLLKEMAREAWLERRHIAKRDAEKANSKLMIPTMLLFLAILVMLMVPVAMNFSGV